MTFNMNTIEPGRVEKAGTINENTDVLREHLLGREGVIDDIDRSERKNGRTQLSGMDIHVRVVQSSAAGNLTPGLAVNYDPAAYGTKVKEVAGAGADAAGIVDPYITQTVEPGDVFLIYTYGPCTVTAGAQIAAGARLKLAANGKFVTATDGDGKGRAIAAAAADNAKFRAFVDFKTVAGYVAPA